ncbi:DUF3108 domain-containing protein [Tenacibaculum tangerinum]|uniref:DUF3108 domain-containing protein n=1 Tax=Tenacibaculum tangerinum TaxID=3038772 RepID=A0ABY8KZA6_9FLAO|nr:DUF3108 domain-containing protein [Tenacibaculum tangerinum]WGH74558.1 DUF3108 domain-containing protein [Tenacibaculum tangerinum]
MRREYLFFILLITVQTFFAQTNTTAYKAGEWLRFNMSYSGFLKAGTAVLELKEKKLGNKKVLHAVGTGKTTGVISWFFKVDDRYESYFGIDKVEPYLFKRKIDEGGHKKNRQITFDHEKNTAFVQDFLKQKDTLISVKSPQDMISTFYFLRSHDTKNMKKGEEIQLDMFFDNKSYPFKLRFLGYEILKTKFGKVKTQKFRPLVQAGRVFKAQESVTIWISADDNKIPIKMRASLAVGSLRAELDGYKELANPFEVIVD